jgi:hypothetical protein
LTADAHHVVAALHSLTQLYSDKGAGRARRDSTASAGHNLARSRRQDRFEIAAGSTIGDFSHGPERRHRLAIGARLPSGGHVNT